MIGPDMGALTLWELAVERADRSPGAVFAISEDGTETTFSELRDRAAHLAEWFGQHGVIPGESVVWQLPTGVEAVTLALALSRLGAVQIPVLPSLGGRGIGPRAHPDRRVDSRCPLPVGTARSSRAGQPRPRVHACPGAAGAVRDRECSGRRVADPPPCAHSWVFYTSGTTAAPKGARHSDATLTACARGMVDRYDVTASDRIAFVFQVTHIGGIVWVYATMLSGCGLILVEKFNREATWSLRRHGVTLAGGALPFLHEFLAAQRAMPEGERLFPRVRAFTFGGMPKPPSIHYEIKRACGGAGVLGAYGMTEAPILTAAGPALSDDELANSEGPPMPGWS